MNKPRQAESLTGPPSQAADGHAAAGGLPPGLSPDRLRAAVKVARESGIVSETQAYLSETASTMEADPVAALVLAIIDAAGFQSASQNTTAKGAARKPGKLL